MCGGRRVASLLFADNAVLLATLHGGLQRSLERFAAECEAVGMQISTSMVHGPEKDGTSTPGRGTGPAPGGGVSRGLA